MRALALGIAMVAMQTTAIAAAGAQDGVYVAPPVLEGGSAEHVMSALEQSVGSGLADAGLTVLPAPEGCAEPECMAAAVAKSSAQGVVVSSVQVEGSDYRLAVEIRDGGGAVLVQREGSCEICTYDEAAEALRGLVATAAGELAPTAPAVTTGPVRVSSSPAGASVMIDGATVGTTPYEGELPAGPHVVEIQKSGHEAARREIEVLAADGASLDVELRRSGGSLSPRTTDIIGWSALGVGVAALGAGIALLVLDDNPVKKSCSGVHVDADGDCEFRYDTLPGGIAFTIVGAVGIAAGTGLVVYARRKRGREPAPMAFGLGRVRGRF